MVTDGDNAGAALLARDLGVLGEDELVAARVDGAGKTEGARPRQRRGGDGDALRVGDAGPARVGSEERHAEQASTGEWRRGATEREDGGHTGVVEDVDVAILVPRAPAMRRSNGRTDPVEVYGQPPLLWQRR